MDPAQTLTAAAEKVRRGDRRIDIALRGPLAEWLEDAAEGDEHGEFNPYALEFARMLVRRVPVQGSGYSPAELLGGAS